MRDRMVAHLELGIVWSLGAKGIQYITLKAPKVALPLLLLCDIPLNGNVHNRSSRDARGKQKRRKLDEMCALAEENLWWSVQSMRHGKREAPRTAIPASGFEEMSEVTGAQGIGITYRACRR